MPITKINFKPGISREGTQYSEQGAWYDGQNIRFRAGKPEKIGGWIKAFSTALKGVPRTMMNWILLDGKDCLAIGTSSKVYIENENVPYDITPIRYSFTGANPITSGSAGSSTQTLTTPVAHGASAGDFFTISGASDVDGICTDVYTNPLVTIPGSSIIIVNTTTAHYAAVGDSVTFSGSTGVGGYGAIEVNATHVIVQVDSTTAYRIQLPSTTYVAATGGGTITAVYLGRLNREFQVASVPTATTVTFNTQAPCTTGGVTGGGGAVTAAFQVSIGNAYNITGGGWGTGTWSRGTWGSPISSSVSRVSLRVWSIDNYGEDLVFCPRDGNLYYWDATNGFSTRAVLVSSLPGASEVPTQVSIVAVTDERHTVAFGSTDRVSTAFDPLLIRWSAQEDVANWTPAATNTSGDLRVPTGSYIMAALSSRLETLVWTDHSLHSFRFIGPPYTFSLQTLAQNTNIVGPMGAVNVNNVTYWMGTDKFWMYTGRVEAIPCTVQRYVYDNLNQNQLPQIVAASHESFTEIIWFYCSSDSARINKYVTYNYADGVWTYGTVARTAWEHCPGRGGLPYAAFGGYDGEPAYLYIQEQGYDDGSTEPATPITAYVESADFGIGDGDKMMFADRIIPDLTFARSTNPTPTVDITVSAKKFPGTTNIDSDTRSVSKEVSQTVDQFTKQVWARMRGRSMRIKIESTEAGVCWLLGDLRLYVREDGKQ
jgi:hypothetical protein